MIPRLSLLDRGYNRSAHSELLGDPQLRDSLSKEPTNLAHVILGQLRSAILAPPSKAFRIRHRGVSALAISISRVVYGESDEEMVRTNAWRVVAVVADENSGRDAPVMELPGETMCGVSQLSDSKVTVATRHAGPLPLQASARAFLDLQPKAFFGSCQSRTTRMMGVAMLLPAFVVQLAETASRVSSRAGVNGARFHGVQLTPTTPGLSI